MTKPAAVIFDLYGTLAEITSLREAVSAVSPEPESFFAAWRDKQIAYSNASALMERYVDFDAITAFALDYTSARFKLALTPEQRKKLLDAWITVRTYPDAVPALRALRERGIATAVLTNGTPQSARRALENAGATEHLDAILSVDAVKSYKPKPDVYRLATEHFGTTADRLAFVSSNGWDATGAAEFGMQVFWCNRSGLPRETMGKPPARELQHLGQLVEALNL